MTRLLRSLALTGTGFLMHSEAKMEDATEILIKMGYTSRVIDVVKESLPLSRGLQDLGIMVFDERLHHVEESLPLSRGLKIC